jgi:phenylacetate-CoA ligase
MSIHFRLRDYFYPRDLIRLRRLFERSQWFSPEQQAAYQEHQLRRVIGQAYHGVPYYQDLFRSLALRPEDIRTPADLQKLPTLSKATLRKEFHRLQATDSRRYCARVAQTSGSSGEPLRFLLDRPANLLEFVYYWRHWSWAGYQLGCRFAELSSHFFMGAAHRVNQLCHYHPVTGRLLLNSLSISPESVAAHASALRRYRPSFFKGIASALYYFAFFLQEMGIRDIGFRGVFSTGEMLLPHQRRLIEQTFHCRVLDSYGHMERTVAISECPQGSLHINPEYGVLELRERAHARIPGGADQVITADVIGTSLHNLSMPLLRYEVGDVVEVDENPETCPCGRSMPRVRRINGRQEDAIVTPDGRVITTLFIVFDKVPGIAHWQVIQDEPDQLQILVVRAPVYTDASEALLRQLIQQFVGLDMKLRVRYLPLDALRSEVSGKFRTIVSRMPQPSRAAAA